MKTENQKLARKLLNEMSFISVCQFGTNRADYRANINGEPYLTVGSLDAPLKKLKKWAKKHRWSALDLFPANVRNRSDYGAVTHLVRVDALENDGEELMTYLYRDTIWADNERKRHEEAVRLSKSQWPTKEDNWRFRRETLSEEDCQKNIDLWEERKRLVYAKEESKDPDIETCIRVLKAAGYKIQRPVIQYEEV